MAIVCDGTVFIHLGGNVADPLNHGMKNLRARTANRLLCMPSNFLHVSGPQQDGHKMTIFCVSGSKHG
jgi:hypothetical protein